MQKLVVIIFIFLTTSSCLTGYILKASYKEIGILLKRQDIVEITQNTSTDNETKEKLKLVLEVREFCKILGLEPKESFTQYSEINDDVLVWVLSASEKYKLKAKSWWFPIVGRVPYKGFFEMADAINKRKELEKHGYDTFLRTSDAFSTLGWFNDPLLSTVLKRDRISIVNTVIHEIVHNTIWIKNSASFNETMANAIANIATIEFYKFKNDEESIQKSIAYSDRELIYAELLESSLNKLDKLYADRGNSNIEIEKQRDEIFNSFSEELLKLNNSKKITNLKINNAYFLAQKTYFNKYQLFFELYKKQGRSIKNMINSLKRVKGDPYDYLNKLI